MENEQDKNRNRSEDTVEQPFVMQNGENVGSLTFGKVQRPVGEVMKLHLVNVPPQESHETQPATNPQVFGTHLKEAIAIVKDWKNRP